MKRIIVCCDGTWMDSDATVQVPSNVTRIARSIRPTARLADGTEIAQVIIYQNGIGTDSKSWYERYVGGATGEGMAAHIREAYSAICLNYAPGDEIFLLGFSRGAFTARSISSLIRAVGLLTPKGLQHFIPIFEDWEYELKAGWRPRYADAPWPGHGPPVTAPAYQRRLVQLELTRPGVRVRAVAVWETVGALGIPMIGLLPQPASRDFAFVDTRVEANVEYAFQALALDERRRAFAPTVWERPPGQALPHVLRQTWFPGSHADVGGAYADADAADITLAWMVGQLDGLLAFDHAYVRALVRAGIERDAAAAAAPSPRDWGLGRLHDSMTAFYRLGGTRIRTPMQYTDQSRVAQHGQLFYLVRRTLLWWANGLLGGGGGGRSPPQRRLHGTNERVHACVRVRMGVRGHDDDDAGGAYDPPALRGWTMYGEWPDPDADTPEVAGAAAARMTNVQWRKTVSSSSSSSSTSTSKGDEQVFVMPEDEMTEFEREIVSLWPRMARHLDSTLPGRHASNVRHAHTDPVDGSKGNAAHPSSTDALLPEPAPESIGNHGGVGGRVETV